MPKITKKEYVLVPEGTYLARLVSVEQVTLDSDQYGRQEKLQFNFQVLEKEQMKGNKLVRVVLPAEQQNVVNAKTGLYYGNKKAGLTTFLNALISPGLANFFSENINDTDKLLGWEGIITVDHNQVGDATYANIGTVTPTDATREKFHSDFKMKEIDPFQD